MKKSRTLLLAAIAMIVLAGMAHGWRTDRWSTNPAISSAVLRLNNIPTNPGRWTSTDQTLSDIEIDVGEIRGYIKRQYRHLDTGAVVHLLLVVGESGPISVHPPTACFAARGFHPVNTPSLWISQSHDQTDDRFMQVDFQNTAVDQSSSIRVYWAWSTGSMWQVPENPRLTFASSPYLYKIYVSEEWVRTGFQDSDPGAARLLMQDLLPHINELLTAEQ